MPHASSDVSSNDEVKVYRVEGEVDDESSAENLKEDKRSLVTEVALKEVLRSSFRRLFTYSLRRAWDVFFFYFVLNLKLF